LVVDFELFLIWLFWLFWKLWKIRNAVVMLPKFCKSLNNCI